jgi:hypothetical protein
MEMAKDSGEQATGGKLSVAIINGDLSPILQVQLDDYGTLKGLPAECCPDSRSNEDFWVPFLIDSV